MKSSLSAVVVVSVYMATVCAVLAQDPEPLVSDLDIRLVATVSGGAVRIAADPASNDLYYLTLDGSVHLLEPPYTNDVVVATTTDHGISTQVIGLALGSDGTLYLTGDDASATELTARVMRGVPGGGGSWSWSSVARTEPYPRSNTPYDHRMNGVVISVDGNSLLINSGSRTEHGEVQDNEGTFPDLRETPLTSAILRVPIDADDLVLPNDEAILVANGYLFADGVRNSFDLAFDGEGNLYATENSGDRDDGDEINRIVEGGHYGFPWRMGLHDTPQQFPGYDPDLDLLLNPASNAYQMGFFHDDPTYPPPPAGVTFIDPVINLGPDANFYRDETDGLVYDASETGEPIATLTPHRSPLGLVFDVSSALPPPYTGDGFVLSWTNGDPGGAPLLIPFGDPAQDLLHLSFSNPDQATVTRIVRGFTGPIDAVQIGTTIYVLEIGSKHGLWAVDFLDPSSTSPEERAALSLSTFPNPVYDYVDVEFELAEPGNVRVSVFDMLGRQITVLVDRTLSTGRHTSRLRAGELAPGNYLVRLEVSGQVQSRQITVVR